ncbi:hypothetical protein FPZ47_14515 [Mycobacterium helveticum]|uniref:AP2-like integrase N-terminal domain-containing protein n=1 Tax=Mycobacterium helveticum TaxID=2592811 RepID=A0A557XQG4_9MYCO|nr:hypothetical protein FPZ46_15810 [Mycobacterium helveticum]TVS88154.1 hypothetical protein FPZ47_14515 [Mycobacterium helveticum]
MKGTVLQRGSVWYYKFRVPERDPSTGRYPWITKGGFDTEREAWKACRDAMRPSRHRHLPGRTTAVPLPRPRLPPMGRRNRSHRPGYHRRPGPQPRPGHRPRPTVGPDRPAPAR